MRYIQEQIIENHRMLDAIRYQQGYETTVETLKDALGVSRTTADKMIIKLEKECTELDVPLLTRSDRKFAINGTAAFF